MIGGIWPADGYCSVVAPSELDRTRRQSVSAPNAYQVGLAYLDQVLQFISTPEHCRGHCAQRRVAAPHRQLMG